MAVLGQSLISGNAPCLNGLIEAINGRLYVPAAANFAVPGTEVSQYADFDGYLPGDGTLVVTNMRAGPIVFIASPTTTNPANRFTVSGHTFDVLTFNSGTSGGVGVYGISDATVSGGSVGSPLAFLDNQSLQDFAHYQLPQLLALTWEPDVIWIETPANSVNHGKPAHDLTSGGIPKPGIIEGYTICVNGIWAKWPNVKIIMPLMDKSWYNGSAGKEAVQDAVDQWMLALQAANPSKVLVINQGGYDFNTEGWGLSGGGQHPNIAYGAYHLGSLEAPQITPKISTTDVSIGFPASGALTSSQGLNPNLVWPGTGGTVTGGQFQGGSVAPNNTVITNTSDVHPTTSKGTGVSGDTAFIVSYSGTATVLGTFHATLTVTPTHPLQAGRAYEMLMEFEASDNAGTGDAIGLYGLSISNASLGEAYTFGSSYEYDASNFLKRHSTMRSRVKVLASGVSSLALVMTGHLAARLLDANLKLVRVDTRANHQDPLNNVLNIQTIANTYNNAPVTITVERGHTVGSVPVTVTVRNAANAVVATQTATIADGAYTGSTVFTPAAFDTFTPTITVATSPYTIGTASTSFTNSDPSATYVAAIAAAGPAVSSTELALLQTMFAGFSDLGAMTHIKRLAILIGERTAQTAMNAMNPTEIATLTGGSWVSNQGWTDDGVAGSGLLWSGWSAGISIHNIAWGVYCNGQSATTGQKVHLGGTATAAKNIINAHSAGTETWNCNGSGAVTVRTGTTRLGFRMAIRNNSASFRAYYNGSPVPSPGPDITQAEVVQNQSHLLGRNNTSVGNDRFAFDLEMDGNFADAAAMDAMASGIYTILFNYANAKGFP